MVIGLAASLLMLGIAATILSAYRYETFKRLRGELRNGAEAGIDYAIAQLNTAAVAGNIASIDIPSGGSGPVTSPVPAVYVPSANMTVQVVVSKVPTTADWQKIASWSSIYAPQLDPANSVSNGFTSPPTTNVQLDRWRIVQSTAQYPSGLYRTITTILQPRYDMPPGGPTMLPPGTNQPYFNNALSGNTAVTLQPTGTSGLIVSGTGSTSPAVLQGGQYNYLLTVSTNQVATVGAGTDLQGNLQVSSSSSGSNPTASANQPNGNLISNLSTSAVIEGRATSNGSFSSSTLQAPTGTPSIPGSGPLPTDNVLANADEFNLPANSPYQFNGSNPNYTSLPRQGTNSTAPTASGLSGSSSIPQNLMAPGVTATTNTSALPSLTSLPVSNGVASLSAGTYQTTNLDTSTLSTPVSIVPTQTQSQTQIFIQGQNNALNPTAVNINSAMFQNNTGDATNLQIWYNGNAPININVSPSAPFNGLIYAPNATVNVSGSGTFTGALVSANAKVTMTGTMGLRTDLANAAPQLEIHRI